MPTTQEMVTAYRDAEIAILAGQSVAWSLPGGGTRQLSRADLAEVRRGRIEWERRLAQEQAAAAGQRTAGGLSFSVARFDQ